MTKEEFHPRRQFRQESRTGDLVITGGGLSGVCCAITAARQGLRVILVQDRPVLGGNGSSEIRLWVLGATSHMGNNNRWSREGGVIDEILVENLYRNPEGNPILFDMLLLDKCTQEKNITLLLNTAVYEVAKSGDRRIAGIKAFCSQNQTVYELSAPLFCDASGDGVVAFLSGAAFRMGAEGKEEFGEGIAPDKGYGELLGHSLYFYSKEMGRPVTFQPPSFALDDITRIPRFRSFNAKEFGCKLWWIEYGGRLDTVHDTEIIKWELWKIVYGVWNYIKNSGEYPEAETMTLEWVGMIPGKRESRRFEGDYMLIQQDIVGQRFHPDAVSHGGWAIDLHPADGVYSADDGCQQWHAKGVYTIPYRCLYSRDIENLFFAGRIISTSHVAFGSTRVMATAAAAAQAVAQAAVLCSVKSLLPADLAGEGQIGLLQQQLLKTGQYIPGIARHDEEDLARRASISASSRLLLTELPADGEWLTLNEAAAMLLPAAAGPLPEMSIEVAAGRPGATLHIELRTSSRPDSYTPDCILEELHIPLADGLQKIAFRFSQSLEKQQYIFVVFQKSPTLNIRTSSRRLTGVVAVFNTTNPAVGNYGRQDPPEGSGMERFEFWVPRRRPGGANMAMSFSTPIHAFAPAQVVNGLARPTDAPNAWIADPKDQHPRLTLHWPFIQRIERVELSFDTDFDHPMESVLMGHPERVIPFCIRHYRLTDDQGRTLYECRDNYRTRNTIVFEAPVYTRELHLHVEHPSSDIPAALFELHCY